MVSRAFRLVEQLITLIGSSSQLAQCFKELTSFKVDSINSSQIDLRNHLEIQTKLQGYKNKILINCSAYNNVEHAEESDEADAVNHLAVRELAKYCSNNDILLIHISTDFVFDGSKGKYLESDDTNPVNKYGESKLSGELAIQTHCNKFIIIRTSWLYSHLDTPNNFLYKMKSLLLKNHQTLVGADDIFGSPTSALSLANAMNHLLHKIEDIKLINRIYHFSDTGRASRLSFLSEINKIFNQKFNLKNSIQPVQNNYFNLQAHRPKDTSLNSNLFSQTFDYKPIDWKSSLLQTINQL